MSPVRFEPAIPATERPETHGLHHAATGIGLLNIRLQENVEIVNLDNTSKR